MKEIEVLSSITDKDMHSILKVWESAVRSTHLFLTEEDITALKPFVIEGVKFISNLLVIRDDNDIIQAFMGVHEDKIEMLFVSNKERGKGLGKKLLKYALETLGVKLIDVNEQNDQGVGFYKHMGFEVFKRSELDEQGNPFPILHLKI